jgi:hypothetical protein
LTAGTSSIAVLENRPELRWPADVYIEGGDQFAAGSTSSLMIGIAAHDRAPYKTVITHGWDARRTAGADAQVGGETRSSLKSHQAVGRGDHSSVVCVVKLFRRHARV